MALLSQFQDRKLVRAVLRGDRRAAETFFDRFFTRLFRFAAVRLDDDDVVEDVVQETLIKAMRNLRHYRGEAALFTWLCQICRNQIADHYRKANRLPDTVPLEDTEPLRAALEALSAGNAGVDTLELNRLIQLTLDHLPQRYGEVLELKYVEGLSVAEIAAALDESQTAVQSVLARARLAFREAFNEISGEVLDSAARPGPAT